MKPSQSIWLLMRMLHSALYPGLAAGYTDRTVHASVFQHSKRMNPNFKIASAQDRLCGLRLLGMKSMQYAES